MEESFGRRRADELGRETGARHARRVGEDRDRNGRKRDHESRAHAALCEMPQDNRQHDERNKRTNAAAGFGHFERAGWATATRCPREAPGIPARLIAISPAREARSWSGNAIWLKMMAGNGTIRRRNASGNRRMRKWWRPQTIQDNPREDADERDACKKQLGAEDAREQHTKTQTNENNARDTGDHRRALQRPATLPREIHRERQDEESMGVVVVARPLSDERRQGPPIHPEKGPCQHTQHCDVTSAERHHGGLHPTSGPARAGGESPPARRVRCRAGASKPAPASGCRR